MLEPVVLDNRWHGPRSVGVFMYCMQCVGGKVLYAYLTVLSSQSMYCEVFNRMHSFHIIIKDDESHTHYPAYVGVMVFSSFYKSS